MSWPLALVGGLGLGMQGFGPGGMFRGSSGNQWAGHHEAREQQKFELQQEAYLDPFGRAVESAKKAGLNPLVAAPGQANFAPGSPIHIRGDAPKGSIGHSLQQMGQDITHAMHRNAERKQRQEIALGDLALRSAELDIRRKELGLHRESGLFNDPVGYFMTLPEKMKRIINEHYEAGEPMPPLLRDSQWKQLQ